MNFDRRSEVRYPVRLPVSFDGGDTGFTRDISAGGLFIELTGKAMQHTAVSFSIALSDNDRPIRFRARGEIVRVELRGERSGIGVRILHSVLEAAEQHNADTITH